jgi:hypothetical protein
MPRSRYNPVFTGLRANLAWPNANELHFFHTRRAGRPPFDAYQIYLLTRAVAIVSNKSRSP